MNCISLVTSVVILNISVQIYMQRYIKSRQARQGIYLSLITLAPSYPW